MKPTEAAVTARVRSELSAGSRARPIAALIAASALSVSCAALAPQAESPGARLAGASPVATDDVLANTVYSALNADPVYYFRHVDVRVDHGIAHLSGYVWSTDALYRARRVARSVPGVTGVVTSQLELERNGRADGVTR